MSNNSNFVKIYDIDNTLIGKGQLLNLSAEIIKVKGSNLPILSAKTNIIIEIYNEISGIEQYFCDVIVASVNQLNAKVKRKDAIFERRKSLKVRADLSFYIESLYRNHDDITNNFPNMRINLLNLSVGGMLISSNYKLQINDIITFSFHYEKSLVILLKAKVIRIDKIYDNNTKIFSTCNYGCAFERMPSYYEDIITRYLYHRQLKMYKDK